MLTWTVNVADVFTNPKMLLAMHVYIPPSCDFTSLIIIPPPDCTIRLSAATLVFSFSHVILRNWISVNIRLQWSYISFVNHHRKRWWDNRGSWDGFTRGPFLGSPVNFSGPKSNIQIEIKSKLLHFISLTDSFIMLDAKLLKPRSLMETETAYRDR